MLRSDTVPLSAVWMSQGPRRPTAANTGIRKRSSILSRWHFKNGQVKARKADVKSCSILRNLTSPLENTYFRFIEGRKWPCSHVSILLVNIMYVSCVFRYPVRDIGI